MSPEWTFSTIPNYQPQWVQQGNRLGLHVAVLNRHLDFPVCCCSWSRQTGNHTDCVLVTLCAAPYDTLLLIFQCTIVNTILPDRLQCLHSCKHQQCVQIMFSNVKAASPFFCTSTNPLLGDPLPDMSSIPSHWLNIIFSKSVKGIQALARTRAPLYNDSQMPCIQIARFHKLEASWNRLPLLFAHMLFWTSRKAYLAVKCIYVW